MQRQIFEVQSKTFSQSVGGYVSNLSGYPKTFDSHSYNDDIDLTLKKAQGAFAEAWSNACKVDNREIQTILLMTIDGVILEKRVLGKLEELPDETS